MNKDDLISFALCKFTYVLIFQVIQFNILENLSIKYYSGQLYFQHYADKYKTLMSSERRAQ